VIKGMIGLEDHVVIRLAVLLGATVEMVMDISKAPDPVAITDIVKSGFDKIFDTYGSPAQMAADLEYLSAAVHVVEQHQSNSIDPNVH
jgi:hypothetical protein